VTQPQIQPMQQTYLRQPPPAQQVQQQVFQQGQQPMLQHMPQRMPAMQQMQQVAYQGSQQMQCGMPAPYATASAVQPPMPAHLAVNGMQPQHVVVGPQPAMPPPPEAACDAVDHDLQPGDWVKLKGIAYNPEYQGKVFCVEVPNVGDGRVMVRFEMSNRLVKKLYLASSALERVEPEAHELPPAAGQAPQVVNGVAVPVARETTALRGRVRIINLAMRPEHDGKFATVIPPGLPDASGCISVQIEGEPTILEIPPSYLEVIDANAGAPIANESHELAGGFRQGEHVRIVNLASRPQHNGKQGVVESMDRAGSLMVRLSEPTTDGTTRLALSPAHLQSLEQVSAMHSNQTMMAHSGGGPHESAAPGPSKLRVTIFGAEGLAHLNFMGDAPWCACSVKHSHARANPSKFQTQQLKGTLSPQWNETHDLDWHVGEPIEFIVYDKGLLSSRTEGTVLVDSAHFYPQGFEGQVPLNGLPHAFLHVRIVPHDGAAAGGAPPHHFMGEQFAVSQQQQHMATQRGLNPGERVRVSGLNQPQLDGQLCVVESMTAQGEYVVQFLDPNLAGNRVSVSGAYLEPC
jgi:hypothetical protein